MSGYPVSLMSKKLLGVLWSHAFTSLPWYLVGHATGRRLPTLFPSIIVNINIIELKNKKKNGSKDKMHGL